MGPRQTAPLSSRRAFEALGASGRRGGSGLFRVRFLAGEVGGPIQVAYSIPRRIGGSVTRNRIRRRLRGAVDLMAADLLPGAYLVSPDAACKDVAFMELVRSLRASLTAAGAMREEHG